MELSTHPHIWESEIPKSVPKPAYLGGAQKAVRKVAPMSRGLLRKRTEQISVFVVMVRKVAPMSRGLLRVSLVSDQHVIEQSERLPR